jgi:hypothetical protein
MVRDLSDVVKYNELDDKREPTKKVEESISGQMKN